MEIPTTVDSSLIFVGENTPLISFIYTILFLILANTPKEYGNILLFYYVAGSAVSIAVNRVLKALIKAPRPGTPKSTNYGMPSGHVQAVSFTMAYLSYTHQLIDFSCSVFRPMLYILIIVMSAWQRVYCRYHTIGQTVVGCIVGIFMAKLITQIMQIKK